MEIVIDVGNTFTKTGYFHHGKMTGHQRFRNDDENWELPEMSKFHSCLVSATTDLPMPVQEICSSIDKSVHLDENTPLPFANLYRTPETLGRDRVAGIAGIRNLFPGTNALVIDAGTSITYDLIDELGRYHGGRISPGLTMRYKALHEFTGRLPEVSSQETRAYLGDSTQSSIRSGVFQGMVEEINGTIKTFANKYPGLVVAICGGDADHLVNHVNYRIFALPNLILLGLHQILTYNANRSQV